MISCLLESVDRCRRGVVHMNKFSTRQTHTAQEGTPTQQRACPQLAFLHVNNNSPGTGVRSTTGP